MARLPRNDEEMKAHLSGRYPHLFRNPVNRAERRWWDKYWKLRGRGFTKTPFKGDSEARKLRQQKQSKKWRAKRESNNKPKGEG